MNAFLSAHLFRLGSLILQRWTDCPGNTRKPLMYMRIETEVRKQKVLWKHVQPRLSIISERRYFLLSKRLLSRTGCSTASVILRVGCCPPPTYSTVTQFPPQSSWPNRAHTVPWSYRCIVQLVNTKCVLPKTKHNLCALLGFPEGLTASHLSLWKTKQKFSNFFGHQKRLS